MDEVIIGITGASGIPYSIKILKALRSLNRKVHLIISNNAKKVIKLESTVPEAEIRQLASIDYDPQDFSAPLASGSVISMKSIGMVIVPCSMKSLAAIANGYSDNLITRAADVIIKENKKLILVPRETPLSLIHLNNLSVLSKLGVIILPPAPGFYTKPKTIDDLISQIVGRILTCLGIPNDLQKPWLG